MVTNSVPIAARLAGMPSISLHLLGGRVRGLTQAAVGEQVLGVLDTLRVDIAFIGTNGISVRHGLSTPDSDEAAVKRAMVACANYVVVVADSSKVGREDFVSFAPLSSVDTLITDCGDQRRRPRAAHRAGRRGGRRMIVTVTPNPSIDRTVTLATPLTRGAVHRVSSVTTEPGGKGVNVARALTLAGVDAVALLPASGTDPLVTALQGSGVPFRCVPITAAVRTNLAITEPDGTTTKLNEPGAVLDAAALDALTRAVVGQRRARLVGGAVRLAAAGRARRLVRRPRRAARPVSAARSRSTPPTGRSPRWSHGFDRAAPDLIKPNAEELAGVLGVSPQALEAAVAQGDPEPVVSAAQQLVDRGVGAVLVTLGAAGAVLVEPDRQLAGHPAADHPAQHRRRRRLQPRRLPARRRRRGRAPAAAADGRRLRQRRRRAARVGAAHPRRGRPRRRSGDVDFADFTHLVNPASS